MPKASLWDNLLPLNPSDVKLEQALKGNGKRIFVANGFRGVGEVEEKLKLIIKLVPTYATHLTFAQWV
jgi:hypothetical protein